MHVNCIILFKDELMFLYKIYLQKNIEKKQLF